jgi:hypothetical protein
VLEGLPINQYREVEITVGANAGDNKPIDKNAWPELPMPRDSHMLPEHSQQLLRAARSGRIYKPPAPPEDDNEMKDEEEEHKEVQTGFVIKKYVKVARHLEATEPEYLAKRRKGLPSQYVVNGVAQPALRETKVKKLDADGNATVYKVLVPEGQAVAGEVQPTDAAIEVAPSTAAPGTVVEGVGVVNAEGVVVASDIIQQTPPRRRPPPPKKKRGGPGRGKKRVVFAEGAATEQGTPASNAAGERLAVPGVKLEGGSVEPSDGDTPMADAGGDDDEGSGEEGSEDEEHEGEHVSHPATPATPSRPSTVPISTPNLDTAKIPTLDPVDPAEPPAAATEDDPQPMDTDIHPEPPAPVQAIAESVKRDPSSSPDLPLSTISHSRQNSLNQIPTAAILAEAEPVAVTVETTETTSLDPVLEPEPVPEIQTATDVVPVAETASVTEAAPIAEVAPIAEAAPSAEVAPIAKVAPVTEIVPAAEIISPAEIVPSAEIVSAAGVVPIAEPEPAQASTTEPEVAQVPVEQSSAPPSEPDLMASLDRHLEKDSKDMTAS